MNNSILIVHDDLESPITRKHLLEMAGYHVRAMQRADACLQAIAESPPALIMCDVLVHGATGFELCARIREHHAADELPVLLTTLYFDAEPYRAEAERVGAQALLARPFTPRELLHHVHRFMIPEAIEVPTQ